MSDKIKYLEHPVTPEEKKKYRDQGYKILDAKFAPKGERVTGKRASKKAEEKPEQPKQEDNGEKQD
jgi:hypothetical protein